MSDVLEFAELELEQNACRARYDFETTAPTVAVASLVQLVTGSELSDLEPLYEVVDPDALDALLRGDQSSSRDGECTVSFPYRELDVTVRSDGVVTVRP
ncbi:HalOD1 output domain-containing protein [Halopiger aswanensis]|uniref:Halobacterial output domain-containing protein n=1 Tax=Halopiger aswanensis TaxID=148449 RepID=A0A419WIT7_9EURY|nr:HalOD1 output domain-containing protein [Halopiger aswanensis]RKD95385.1 hypothetical protein ATJ93_2238 [Halopiger aswanensis]